MEFLVCWSGQYIYVCVNVCCLLPLQPPPLLLCSSFLTVRCRFVCCLSHCSTLPPTSTHSLLPRLAVRLYVSLYVSVCLSLSLSIWPLYLPASIQFVLVFFSLSFSLSVFCCQFLHFLFPLPLHCFTRIIPPGNFTFSCSCSHFTAFASFSVACPVFLLFPPPLQLCPA